MLRLRLRGPHLQGLFLALTLSLAAWLGYQAFDAAASHRLTAEAALRDYAGISASEFAGAVRGELDHVFDDVFQPVRRRLRGDLPSPAVVGWGMEEWLEDHPCDCPSFERPIVFFRVDASDGQIDAVPDTVSTATLRQIADMVSLQDPGDDRIDSGLFTAGPGTLFVEAVVVGFMISHDQDGTTEASFGFVVPVSALAEVMGKWYDDRKLLPEPIGGDLPNDSLLYLRVRDAEGLTVFASPSEEPEAWSASEPIGPDAGTLVVEATIRPEAAPQLIIGGLPKSRLPLLAVLMLLTTGVGALSLLQIRREQRFQRLRDDFVSGVSHELRTPLAQIQVFADLQAAGKLTSEEDQARANSVIHRESRRLGHLVENILQISMLNRTSGLGLPMEELNATEAYAEGIDALAPFLHDRGMTLDVAATDDLLVSANRESLTRIVVNLLDNAVKYGPNGQTISVDIGRSNGSARLAVADEGPGVPEADRARIFKAYRRLERDVASPQPGTGIGLSVVAELTNLHRGRAWVEDVKGGGARFVVELPLLENATEPIE